MATSNCRALPFPPSAYQVILEVSFECDHCEADTPVRDAKRAVLDGPLGAFAVDLCPACYRDGIEDGILTDLPTH